MNEIDQLRDLAARTIPTPSLDAWAATEILADLLVQRGTFTPPKFKGERFNAKNPETREAQRERGRDRHRRCFVTAARRWAIELLTLRSLTSGSYFVQIDSAEFVETKCLSVWLVVSFKVLESTDQLAHPIGASREWSYRLGRPGPLPKALLPGPDEKCITRLPGAMRRVEVNAKTTKSGRLVNFVCWHPDGDDTHPGALAETQKLARFASAYGMREEKFLQMLENDHIATSFIR